jgi:hypothetical protein
MGKLDCFFKTEILAFFSFSTLKWAKKFNGSIPKPLFIFFLSQLKESIEYLQNKNPPAEDPITSLFLIFLLKSSIFKTCFFKSDSFPPAK